MKNLELKDIRVFVCVPGVRKTTLCERNNRFVDMDSIKARYKYELENSSKEVMEALKGHYGKAVRKDTYTHMEELTFELLEKTDKIMLFAPNPQMVNMLFEKNVPYCLVYHSLDCIEEYKERMRNRGNKEDYIETMLGDGVLYDFYKNSVNDARPSFKIELQPNEYLSDKLLDIFNEKI